LILTPLGAPAQTNGPIDVLRLDDSPLRIENFAEHRATAVVVLSTRSNASEAAAAQIRDFNAAVRRQNVMTVAIFPNPAESGDEIRVFCQTAAFVFPCYRDAEHKAVRQLSARVTPEAFLCDSKGTVVFRGAVDSLQQAFSDWIAGRPAPASAVASGTPIDQPGPARPFKDPYDPISFSSELIFEKIPGVPAHHASTITLAANGDLLVAWYGGSYESSDDEQLLFARRRKGQREWDKPQSLLRNLKEPVGNAVIFTTPDGKVWIIWARMESSQPMRAHTGWDQTSLFFRVSDDHGYTWSKDEKFPMDTTGWLPRNLAVRLKDGTTVVPLSDERNNNDVSFVVLTKDNGQSWVRSNSMPNAETQGEQPAVAQRRDGSLLAFLRTRPRLLQTESVDGGMTWSPAKPTDFKNPDAAISLSTLRNGNLLLVWNNLERGRYQLHIARSTDDGKTWSEPQLLESNPGEFSYPAIMQAPDGKIHVTYTYRRYSIKHLEFTENWLTTTDRAN
jgi:predicted neuraminidase